MKQPYDFEQVTKPVDVAREAAWIGVGSGTCEEVAFSTPCYLNP